MPLEQLLARYGYASNTTPAESNPASSSAKTAATTPVKAPASPKASQPAATLDLKAAATVESLLVLRDQGKSSIPGAPTVLSDAQQDHVAEEVQVAGEAQQAAAAGMDAFEHSQALAERRASGAQAGPSGTVTSAPGQSCMPCPSCLSLSLLSGQQFAAGTSSFAAAGQGHPASQAGLHGHVHLMAMFSKFC